MNILVKEDNTACITDLGLAAFANVTSNQYATVMGGAAMWLPPETFDPKGTSTRQTTFGDIYAFACVCIEVS